MRKYLLLLLLITSVQADTIPGNVFIDFEDSTDGTTITAAIMTNVVHGRAFQVFMSDQDDYSAGSPSNTKIETDAQFNLFTPANINGTVFSGVGTRGMRITHGANGFFVMNFPAAIPNFTIGFYFRWSGPGQNFSPRDTVGMTDSGGRYQFLQNYDQGPSTDPYYQTHWAFSGTGNDIFFKRGVWYWVTMNYAEVGETMRIRTYNATNQVQLGESTATGFVAGSVGPTKLVFGLVKYGDSPPATSAQYFDFDNIIINTNGVFPLGPGSGAVVATTNSVDWTLTGVPGGIPGRTTVYATHTAGATRAQVQTSLDNCPSNQVVLLDGAAVNVSATGLSIGTSGVVLRGTNGAMVYGTGDASTALIKLESTVLSGSESIVGLASGYTKGATNLVMSGTDADVKVGTIVVVNQTQDGIFVRNDGVGGPRADIGVDGDVDRVLAQSVQIRAVSGTSITVWPPLYWTYTSGRTPQIYLRNSASSQNYLTMAGVENLIISNSSAACLANIYLNRSSYCWISNNILINGGVNHILVRNSYSPEIRRNTWRDALVTAASAGYGLNFEYQTSNGKIEDNIAANVRTFCQINSGSSGNYIGYNYATNLVANTDVPDFSTHSFGAHSCHAMMNLWEGNIIRGKFVSDFYWGSESHACLVRNWIYGSAAQTYADQSGAAIIMDGTNSYHTVVGNVLGMSTLSGNPKWTTRTSLKISPASMPYENNYATFRIGYYSDGDVGSGFNSSNQWNNYTVGGNYDYVSGAIAWYRPTSAEPIPYSMVYTSQPAWMSPFPWPPIEATNIAILNETNIPASYRWQFGGDLPPVPPPVGPSRIVAPLVKQRP